MADVIDFKRKPSEPEKEEAPPTDLEALEKINAANKERIKRERARHNANVTREYRLK